MALDHVDANVRINCVAPGTVESPYFTEMFRASADPAALRAGLEGQPSGKFAFLHVEEILDGAVLLDRQLLGELVEPGRIGGLRERRWRQRNCHDGCDDEGLQAGSRHGGLRGLDLTET